MTQFNNFSTILPDPSVNWGSAGEENAATGSPGPGFSSIQESSEDPIMKVRFNSERLDRTSATFHKWGFNISYNSIVRDELDMVFTFLLHKSLTLEPFFVSIPKYRDQITTNKLTDGARVAGSSTLYITGTGIAVGSMFKIADQIKIYKIVRVETETDHNTNLGAVAAGKERIHIVPPMQKDIATGSTLVFTNLLFRVQQTGELSTTVNARNLYSFKLTVEEV